MILDKIITIYENNFDIKYHRRKIIDELIDKFRNFVNVNNIKTSNANKSSDETKTSDATKTNDVVTNDFVFRRYSTNLTNKILQIFLKINLSMI